MAAPSNVPTADSIIQAVADSSKDDGPISIIVTMKVKAAHVARAVELVAVQEYVASSRRCLEWCNVADG